MNLRTRATFAALLSVLGFASARVGGGPDATTRDLSGCQAEWQQCGGNGYSGPTCCNPGYQCVEDEWWSQCKPAPVDPDTVPAWGKCGGTGYNGATQCTSGYKCVEQNDWYSQCLPCGANCGPAPATTPNPTPLPSPAPTPLPTPLPSPAPTPLPSPAPTPLPTPLPSPAPTPLPSPAPTPLPTDAPTSTPRSFGELKSCLVTGDPHFDTFAGVTHSFMGQPSEKDSFYYVAPCAGPTVKDPPFRILGKHTAKQGGATLDYLTLELLNDDGSVVHFFASSGLHHYALNQNDPDYDSIDPATMQTVTSAVQTSLGLRFQIRYIQVSFRQAYFELLVDGNKAVEIHAYGTNFFGGRFRQHTAVIRVDTAYENELCGLCGPLDVSTVNVGGSISIMPAFCGQDAIDFPTNPGESIHPSGALYDIDGWSYEREFYLNNCGNYYDITDNAGSNTATKSCSAPIAQAVADVCDAAKAAASTACTQVDADLPGYCDNLLSYCKIDACVIADGDVTAIDDAVQDSFTDVINGLAQLDLSS